METDAKPRFRVEPLDRETLQDRVYNQLASLILDGGISPGQLVTIQGLADAFGVSTMPVREALKRLSGASALTVVSGRSIGIPPLTLERLIDLRNVRLEIEGTAVAWAAQTIDAVSLDQVKDQLGRMDRSIVGRRPRLSPGEPRFSFHYLPSGWISDTRQPNRDTLAADQPLLQSPSRVRKLCAGQHPSPGDDGGPRSSRRRGSARRYHLGHHRLVRSPSENPQLTMTANRFLLEEDPIGLPRGAWAATSAARSASTRGRSSA